MTRSILFSALIALAGCRSSYEEQSDALTKYAAKHRIGGSPDFFLVKRNILGEWEKVALIYGFAPDYDFCEEVAHMYMAKYPDSAYACQVAN